jgi:hypothetical protein
MKRKLDLASETPVSRLQAQLLAHQKLLAEDAALELLESDLKADEARLVSGDFDIHDAEQFALLSQLRLKREIVPNRRRRIAEQITVLESEIGTAAALTGPVVRDLIRARCEALASALEKKILALGFPASSARDKHEGHPLTELIALHPEIAECHRLEQACQTHYFQSPLTSAGNIIGGYNAFIALPPLAD